MLSKFDEDFIRRLRTENININQRRVINAHDAIDPDDYVTKRQLESTVTQAIAAIPPPVSSGGDTINISGDGVIIYVGTLSPDTKPALTILDANKVLFYATDFDRTYRWTGTVWLEFAAIPRAVEWLIFAPESAGYALCNGATVTRSKPDGTTTSVTLPNLIGQYIRGASSYSGSIIPPVAPTFSSGLAASNGSHSHTGFTNSGSNDGGHEHHVTFSGETSTGGAHGHGVTEPSAGDHSHTVTGSGDGTTGFSNDCVAVTSAGEPFDDVADCAHTHQVSITVSGSTSTDGSHTHGVSVDDADNHLHTVTDETLDGLAEITGTGIVFGFIDSAHRHVISTDGSHTHTVTGTISDTATPTTVELMPYFRL